MFLCAGLRVASGAEGAAGTEGATDVLLLELLRGKRCQETQPECCHCP